MAVPIGGPSTLCQTQKFEKISDRCAVIQALSYIQLGGIRFPRLLCRGYTRSHYAAHCRRQILPLEITGLIGKGGMGEGVRRAWALRDEQSGTSAVVPHYVSDLPTDGGLGERSLLS